jgi:hypothetical protein
MNQYSYPGKNRRLLLILLLIFAVALFAGVKTGRSAVFLPVDLFLCGALLLLHRKQKSLNGD